MPESLPDEVRFLETLHSLREGPAELRGFFDPSREICIARAPGRLDLMGGIADYSGSLVLQLPIQEATFAAVQRDPEPVLRIASLGADATDRSSVFEMPLADFRRRDGEPLTYEAAREYFAKDPRTGWAAYAAGSLLVLMRERGVQFPGGTRVLIASEVPEGKGVSSSAAIEVAVMQAVVAAFGVSLEGRDLAILCQMAENRVVGAPCGVMDQMTSACGEAHRLLALLCQPAEIQGQVPLPNEVAVWGIDSGVRHSVSGADYGSVRVGAFMGYRIVADALDLPCEQDADSVAILDPDWQGFLANITPSEWEQRLACHLPERIGGAEFLARFGGTTDPVTHVDPARTYAVRIPAGHPVYENFRVRAFAELLLSGALTERRLELLGELMYQSHASYSACGLGSEATDRVVELVREAGPQSGLFGAKITGGGSGGTVAVFGRAGAEAAVRQVVERYAAETGRAPYLFSSSSPGAVAFGVRVLSPDGSISDRKANR
jgi:L-arabinokinase